jgi:surface antigen
MRRTWFPLVGLVAISLSACADIQNSPKQSAGTLLGAWAGSEVGKSLDRADRLAAAQATHNALEHTPTGAATTWRNPDTGHAGSVTPLRTYQAGGRDCRDFEQTLFIDGQAETVRSTACRQPDGTWRVQG